LFERDPLHNQERKIGIIEPSEYTILEIFNHKEQSPTTVLVHTA